MADMPIQAAVTTLQVHRVDSISSWAGAARVLQQAAEKGQDLSPYLDILRQAYLESHQLPVMEPLARAVTAHALNQNDMAGLGRLLAEPEFGRYLVVALAPGWKLGTSERNLVSECYQQMLKQGADLTPILPQLTEAMLSPQACYVESYFIADLTRFLARTERLPEVEKFLLAGPDISGGASHALAEEAVDLTPLLPTLAGLLSHRHWYVAEGARRALQAHAKKYGKAAVEAALVGQPPSEAGTQLEKQFEAEP